MKFSLKDITDLIQAATFFLLVLLIALMLSAVGILELDTLISMLNASDVGPILNVDVFD